MRTRLMVVVITGLAILAVIVTSGLTQPRRVPSVTVTTLDGTQIPLNAMPDEVVLVNFWATTCVVCMREMPRLVDIFEKYRARGFRTVAIAMPYDPPNRVLDYSRRRSLPFDVALDVDGSVLRAFGDVPGTPTSYLIDKRGIIVRKYVGEPDFDELERRIQVALKAG